MQPPSQPFIVKVIEEPKDELNFGDVIIAAFGVTGVLVLLALLLGAVMAFVLIRWHRRHPPELAHLPSVTPAAADPDVPPSAPVP
jgi:hypothetical protein